MIGCDPGESQVIWKDREVGKGDSSRRHSMGRGRTKQARAERQTSPVAFRESDSRTDTKPIRGRRKQGQRQFKVHGRDGDIPDLYSLRKHSLVKVAHGSPQAVMRSDNEQALSRPGSMARLFSRQVEYCSWRWVTGDRSGGPVAENNRSLNSEL
ncbi:hypothetical protein BD410DRAFT_831718 [Rickenella mellea]|uniref:Uncharacterized protein n=1 Tax=Rickenella mellea TaxID=50990 RepID=A0A4Y7PNQ0_9AGAM|nr:hypothetical protein BD410DRAFT_831718 [Rickenella mellea]